MDGHIIGLVVITPFILVWRQPSAHFTYNRIVEIILFYSITLFALCAIFLDAFNEYVGAINRGYWMFLIASIAAIRFGRHGASLVILFTTALALAGSINELGFFKYDIEKTQLSNYWVYSMVVVLVGMIQATFIKERKKEANYDSLTNLPNRRLFEDRLTQELINVKRTNNNLILLFMDLDHFKEVNDTLGHHLGDVLLLEASKRMKKCIRENDTLARLGGDEFTIILPDIKELYVIENITSKILKELSNPFIIKNETIFISVSIGISIAPTDTLNQKDLLKYADQAMYTAKKQGRNRIAYFKRSMQEKALEYMKIANDLKIAIDEDQFELYYQPILNLQTGRIDKAEALIRWEHPTLGTIYPSKFIKIAEERGLIEDIGKWVFITAVKQVKQWQHIIHKDFRLSINVSPIQFTSKKNKFDFIEYLEENNIPTKHITIEITESLLMNDNSYILNKLKMLRKAGLTIAIDDFGTGYSSLSYLRKFPIDYLKIDQSFIFNLMESKETQSVVDAIIAMAKALNLKIIAEGIGNKEQRKFLKSLKCDFGQGYLFAKPLTTTKFEQFLAQKKK